MKNTPRPPKRGDKVFSTGPRGKSFSPHYTALLQASHDKGFYIAAEMVVEKYQSANRRPYRNELFFPVTYLYRHFIELKLKNLLRCGLLLNVVKPTDKTALALHSHDLCKLWTQVKPLIISRWPDADPAPLKAVEAVIN